MIKHTNQQALQMQDFRKRAKKTINLKEMRHIEMPKAAPKSRFVIFKTRDDIEISKIL